MIFIMNARCDWLTKLTKSLLRLIGGQMEVKLFLLQAAL
jgi:hypothetical protein